MGAHQSGTRCPFERRKSPTYQNPAFLSDKDKAQITGKEFGKCFEKSELSMLDGLFKEISHPHQLKGTRKEIKVLDKITFLRLFKVPGLLGERLFAVFDTKHQGVIDYDEFIAGLAIYCRGSTEDKLKMLFDMYDVTGTGAVSREELTTMLFSLITPTHYFFQPQSTSTSTHKDSLVPSTSSNTSQKLSHEISDPSMNASTTSSSSNSSSNSDHSVTQPTLSESSSSTDSSPGILARRIAARIADRDTSPSPQPEIHEDTQQDSWGHMDREFRSLKVMDDHQLVETIVKDAFEKCDTSKDGKLQFDEFVEFIRTTPTIVEALEKAFVFQYWNDHHIKNKKKSRSPVLSGKTSPKHSRHGSLATSHHNMKVNSLTMPASAFPMKKSLTSDLNSDTSKPPVLRSTSQGSGLVPPINNIPTSRSFGSLADLQPRTLHLSPSANHMIEGATVYCPDCGFQLRFCHKCGHQLIIQSLSNITCTGSCGTSTQEYENCTQCGKQLQQTSSSLPLLQSPVNGMSSPGRSVVPPIANTVAASADDIINENLYHAGTLYKQSKYLKRWKTRWSVLRHNILYIFQDSNELHCSHALFMESQFVDIPTIQEYAKDGYYSFQLTNCRSKVTRTYYAKSEKERDGWVTVLRQSAKTTGIESRYELGKQIGKGKFSTVVEAKHIETHEMYAVKVIDKARVCQDPMELEALRTEIAILKLIDHPYVVKMRELFVSKSHLYIVMDLLRGGDLFDRLIQRGHFSETTTKQIVHKLLQAISYLHARGIVHRDLKPENILCISENDDSNIMIADFGLSKFATPTEVMNLPCGTLAYVAPEVLKLQGYGKSVDLWSIGIIGFLLLSGILPFDGSSKAQIIERTLHAKIHFDADVFKHVSADAKDVISRLLHKNPQQRMTVEEALAHPWFKDLPSRLSPRNRAIKG